MPAFVMAIAIVMSNLGVPVKLAVVLVVFSLFIPGVTVEFPVIFVGTPIVVGFYFPTIVVVVIGKTGNSDSDKHYSAKR